VTEFTVLTWNIFHGRDAPPVPALFTRRSRLLRTTEDDGTYVQVNRVLQDEYVSLIAKAQWSVCLLQETPPSWARPLAAGSAAQACRVLTSRNLLGAVRAALARLNPDLVGSNEGGSNLTLVRPPWRLVRGSCRSLVLNPLRERRLDERRRMGFLRMRLEEQDGDVCVANLHASTGPPEQTETELRRAARTAVEWAGEAPLVLGGDFNLRPHNHAELFDELAREYGLIGATAPDAIDHLLVRRLGVVEAPAAWPAGQRELEVEVPAGRRRLRLSDHAPVEARFRLT
jgi:endonuclease/exonuclease/phosphatase family metal-dependent hydrolase